LPVGAVLKARHGLIAVKTVSGGGVCAVAGRAGRAQQMTAARIMRMETSPWRRASAWAARLVVIGAGGNLTGGISGA
jgi:hypothetical protein